MDTQIQALLQGNSLLWRGRECSGLRTIPTGFAALDSTLPGGGWPLGAIAEIVVPGHGMGELRLLMPALVEASRERRVAWIDPPFIPYAPALEAENIQLEKMVVVHSSPKDFGWTMEQLLRVCGMVMAWPRKLSRNVIRRLQLAAASGQSLGVLFMHADAGPSPAALRLALWSIDGKMEVNILKTRGTPGGSRIVLPLIDTR
jgi:hypothetical protein